MTVPSHCAPALTALGGLQLQPSDSTFSQQTTTPSAHHESACRITTRPATRSTQRVVRFELPRARFCVHLPCHTRFCASPLQPASSIATTRSDFRRSFITLIHCAHRSTAKPHDNAIAAPCTRQNTRRDCHSLKVALPPPPAVIAPEVSSPIHRLLFAPHNTHTHLSPRWRRYRPRQTRAAPSCPAA